MALTTVPASLSATALTLTTAAQPNITSVGTLTGLTVSGNIAGTLITAAQTNITSVGTLTGLDTTGDITVTKSSARVRAIESGGATTQIASGGATGYVGTYSNHPIQILSNSTAAITIDTSQKATFAGNVSVGGSAYTTSADLNLLGDGLAIKNDKAGSNNNWSLIQNTATSTDANLEFTTGLGSALVLNHNKSATFAAGGTFAATVVVDVGAPGSADQTLISGRSQAGREIGFVWDDSQSTLGVATLTAHDMAFHTGGNSSEKFRIYNGNGYLAAQSASQVRLVLGSAGNYNDNSSNWIRGNSNLLQFNTAGGNYNWEVSGNTKMTLTSSGLFGVGSHTPDTAVHIQGSGHQRLKVQSTGSFSDLQFKSGNSTTQWILFNDSDSGNNSGVIKYQHTDNSMRIRTNDVDDRVVIDSSGRVAMAYQPSAAREVTSSVGSINCHTGGFYRIYFGTSRHDQGGLHSAYGGNSANGSKFTAPVAGKYFYSCMVRIDGFSGNYFYLDMRVNDTTRQRHLDSETGSYIHRTVAGVYNLAVGDYITFEIANSGDSNVQMDNNTYMSMHFLG